MNRRRLAALVAGLLACIGGAACGGLITTDECPQSALRSACGAVNRCETAADLGSFTRAPSYGELVEASRSMWFRLRAPEDGVRLRLASPHADRLVVLSRPAGTVNVGEELWVPPSSSGRVVFRLERAECEADTPATIQLLPGAE